MDVNDVINDLLADGQKLAECLKNYIAEYGNDSFIISGKEYPADVLIKELQSDSEIGTIFRKKVITVVISHLLMTAMS